ADVDLNGKSVEDVSDAWLAAHKDAWSTWIK
ncbi:MAG: glycine betaine/proline transport system substrate-binding protein, partial [Paracoccaceae bacterium]